MPSPHPSTTPKPPEKSSESNPPKSPSIDPITRFSPEEEASLLKESNDQKTHANTLYASHEYSQAISEYDKALASCPNYLEYEIAVLKANVAACHLQLSEWEAAVQAATAALEALERLMPTPKPKDLPANGDSKQQHQQEDTVVELPSTTDEAATEEALRALELTDHQHAATTKLRTKALLRRAKAKSALDGWANLQTAEDDYKTISSTPALEAGLSAGDRRVVREALRMLPGRIAQCREKEMGEMMGKLKEVGNGILKPFGLSTDMFKVQQGEGGGYSMSFDQGK